MGCGPSAIPPPALYTLEELKSEMAQLSPTLKRAGNGGHGPNVLEIEGSGWIFNDKPPLDTGLLRGLITPEKFQQIVASLNTAHAEAMVGQTKRFNMTEIPARRMIGHNAVATQINVINQDLAASGIRMDMDVGQEETNITNISGGGRRPGKKGARPIKVEKTITQETLVYIIFPTAATGTAAAPALALPNYADAAPGPAGVASAPLHSFAVEDAAAAVSAPAAGADFGFCSSCGAARPDSTSQFCSHCGAQYS
jgi:hypothetical protein